MAFINRDFIVKNGIIVEGDSAVTSSTNQSNAMQISGGAAIAKNLIVGTTATFFGDVWIGGEIVAEKLTIEYTTVTTTLVVTDDIIRTSNTTASTSTDSGALVIAGGAGIGGALNIGLPSFINGAEILTSATVNLYASQTAIFAGTDTAVNTSTGNVTVWNVSTLESVTGRGSSSTHAITITNATSATDAYSGALIVTGGVGIGEKLYVADSAYVAGARVITTATVNDFANQTFIYAGTDTAVNTSTGNITVWNTSNLQSVTDRGAATTNAVSITNSTESTSTTTGAFVVSGGVGIGKNLNVHGQLSVDGGATVLGALVITTATVNDFANQTAIFAGTDTAVNTSTGNITIWNTSTLQSITNRGATTNNALSITNTTASTGTTTGALVVSGGVGIGGDVYASNLHSVNIYTTSVYSTDVVSTNINATDIYGSNVYDQNARVVTTATIPNYAVTTLTAGTDTSISASKGDVTVWNTSTLQSVTNRGATTDNAISITNTSASTSTTTGALTVVGGIGTRGNIYAGDIYSNGEKVLTSGGGGGGYVSSLIAGTDTAINTSTGVVTIWNTSTLETVMGRGATSSYAMTLTNQSASTTTIANNALYIQGGLGVGKSLYVTGEAVFTNNVLFNGTTTYVYTTNTVYTDNILELHNPGPAGLNNQWLTNDGKDIGIRFHYYDDQDRNAALVFSNDTKYLEWYDRGAEGTNIFVGTRYGKVRTGSLVLTDTTVATNTSSGALQVAGGVGIGGALYVQDLFVVGTSNVSSTGTVNIGNATATTIVISSTATIGSLDVDGRVVFATGLHITSSTNSTSTTTGALIVDGGAGFGRDLHIGGSITVGLPNDGVAIPAVYSNNVQLASYTSNVITGSGATNLDQWSSSIYRTARYTVQVVDGGNVHITEIVVFHDGTNAYVNEYGVTTNNGELGTFSAVLLGGFVTMTFTPTSATAMTIKVVRLAITL